MTILPLTLPARVHETTRVWHPTSLKRTLEYNFHLCNLNFQNQCQFLAKKTLYIHIQIVPGRAGGGSFRRKQLETKKNNLLIECAQGDQPVRCPKYHIIYIYIYFFFIISIYGCEIVFGFIIVFCWFSFVSIFVRVFSRGYWWHFLSFCYNVAIFPSFSCDLGLFAARSFFSYFFCAEYFLEVFQLYVSGFLEFLVIFGVFRCFHVAFWCFGLWPAGFFFAELCLLCAAFSLVFLFGVFPSFGGFAPWRFCFCYFLFLYVAVCSPIVSFQLQKHKQTSKVGRGVGGKGRATFSPRKPGVSSAFTLWL